MRAFYCQCGNRVFFDNTGCMNCGRSLGFDPARLELLSLDTLPDASLADAAGHTWRRCGNQLEHDNCNWLVPARSDATLCRSCSLNEMIPALGKTNNLYLWTKVEQAKRRLIYSLVSHGLPLVRPGGSGMRFRIMEDRRRNPDVFESFVATAHFDGTITLNIAEADDATRHAVREQMQERYRTVLGHLRHESGHFYFSMLTDGADILAKCRELFGDERSDYETTLNAYYEAGPPADWHQHFVSAYAASHPAEDFAETFAHFLHIHDALESARVAGLAPEDPDGKDWMGDWIKLAITLNEIGRSLGTGDAYPFVLTEPVERKLAFMDRLVRRQAEPPGG